ncbi:MAG: Hint domain-containing protein [Rhodobacter sp.]|nr:Hint domain-containing protein [Rhodobacter sp.]
MVVSIPADFEFDIGGTTAISTTTTPFGGGPAQSTDNGVDFTFSFASGTGTNASFGFVDVNPGGGGTPIGGAFGAGGQTVTSFVGTLTFVSAGNPANTYLTGRATDPLRINVTQVGVSKMTLSLFDTNAGTLPVKVFSNITGPTLLSTPNAIQFNKLVFSLSGAGSGANFINDITANINCFCAGTRIATPNGAKAVEHLQAGDSILTANGGETAVKWLGLQPVNTRLTHPAKVNPICFIAGALADGVPSRDLWVSADHAIGIDGMLINAGALVNGETIYQVRDMPLGGFTYYHVETTGGHELIIAEGVAAESYVDYADTEGFVNAGERDGLTIPEMDLSRISSARLVPTAIRARLAARTARATGKAA